jgi:tetratricopeptide (TPR) repeat protein
MNRSARFFLLLLFAGLCCPGLLAAQESPDTAVVTQPRPRVGPPPANATAAELEAKADELRQEKSYVDALDYYRAALNKQSSAVLLNKMGITELQLARHDDARKHFQKAIKADRKYPDAYNNLGVIYYVDKKYNRAVKQYRKALQLREESASFHSNLGTAYFAQKKIGDAMKEYVRAMQIDPDVFERKSQAGIAAQMSSPEDRAHYSYVLAKMYAQSGNFDRALLYLRKAIEDGYREIDNVYKDQEFAGLRKDKRFGELMAAKPVSIPQ